MLRWILQHVCLCFTPDPEHQPLIPSHPSDPSFKSRFPPPDTILTAPRPRPTPLVELPHHRLLAQRRAQTSFASSPSATTGPPDLSIGTAGVRPDSAASSGWDSPGRLGGISRFYSQRMRPLARSSLPPTPASHAHTHSRNSLSHTSHPTTSTYNSIPPPQSRTVPSSPVQPLHASPARPIHPSHPSHPYPETEEARPALLSRSISAPQALSLHLHSLRSSRPSHPTLYSPSRTAEIEGFSAHQLPNGAMTDPRTVMIYRGRPRSATILPSGARSTSTSTSTIGAGLAVERLGLRSVSDEGLPRGSGPEGLDWTGRRGRSPGPTRIGMSRRSTSNTGGVGRGVAGRTASRLGSREGSVVALAVPESESPGEVSPDMSIDGESSGVAQPSAAGEVERQREVKVTKMDLGLVEMFRPPLGHRQTRSAGEILGGGRGGSRPGRGKKRITTN